MNNHFDQRSEGRIRDDMVTQFKEEFKPKSHFEEWLPIYNSGRIFRFILQVLSALAAATLVAYPSKFFFDTWIPGIIVSVAILYFLEKLKRRSADVGFRRLLVDKSVPAFVLVVGLLASGASFALSVLGTPILVAEIAPDPTLINLTEIQDSFEAKQQEAVAFWTPQIDSAEKKATKVFDQGSYKGKISGRTKTQKYKHDNQASAKQDSLNLALASIQAAQDKASNEATKQNKLTTIDSADQVASVGFWTGVGCACLEVLFYLISFFLVRFRYISSIQLSDRNTPPPSTPDPGNRKKQKSFFDDIGGQFRNILKQNPSIENKKQETRNDRETEYQKQSKQETKQKQQPATVDQADITQNNRNETRNNQESKTVILNKDVNHGTVTTDKVGNKVLYYITNKDKKNESVKYYTESEVSKMIGTYEKRLKAARTMKNMKSVATNVAKVKQWTEYKHKLKNYNPIIA